MRYFVPPVHMQDSLKTLNVKSLEGSDVTTIQCPTLACIEQCRDADGIVNGHLGACRKVQRSWFVKMRLDSFPKEVDARLTWH